ncbi:hypothetical protein [Rhizobium leguminosarum]|uniref:Uncharacterized protein n=1 Tax=Rhizobium leguminosarum TaxID=384 RepID=A0A1B1CI63_RHILE|nr:hypothetical protein [Rhizobium leguminosarum]ANP89452.1 hypothetical protein BA011_27215 [Rhizobium leguminosarum]
MRVDEDGPAVPSPNRHGYGRGDPIEMIYQSLVCEQHKRGYELGGDQAQQRVDVLAYYGGARLMATVFDELHNAVFMRMGAMPLALLGLRVRR